MVKNYFNDVETNIKKQCLFFGMSMLFLFVLWFASLNMIRTARKMAYITESNSVNDFKILFRVNEIKEEGDKFFFEGRIFRLDSQNLDINLVLESEDGTEIHIADTKWREEENEQGVSEKLDIGGKSEFQATVSKDILQDDECYKIQLALEYMEDITQEENKIIKKIFSGNYLFDGKIYKYNPLAYEEPQVFDEQLTRVIIKENLRFFDSEMGCWVYECDNSLYFIINQQFGLTDARKQRIKFHTHTAQIELLDESRQQYGCDSRDFFFDEKEYMLTEKSEYRIAMLKLPLEYEVSWVELGMYEKERGMLRDFSFALFD